MEIALRRLDGVDKVAISIQRQQFVVLYKPGTSFQPKDLRAAVGEADVSVTQFHIQARGRVEAQGDKKFFIAGKDRFLLTAPPQMPANTEVMIGADVNDQVSPMQIKVFEFRPLNQK